MSSDDTSPVLDIAQTRIGANTINTLLKTTTRCEKLTISELIVNCVEGIQFNEGAPSIGYCKKYNEDYASIPINSCEYAMLIIEPIIHETLDGLGLNYQFNVLAEENGGFKALSELNATSGTCIQKKHFEQPIPRPSGLLAKVILDIC